MDSITVSYDDRSDEETMRFVLEQAFEGSYFGGGTESLETAEGTDWGDPNNWYTSGKFMFTYATIGTEDWLTIHDSIGHGREGATSSTVEWVIERIENGEEDEIETPTLALEPEEFGVEPLEYTPVKEGRSRGVGAKEAGLDRIPVLVSVRRPWL